MPRENSEKSHEFFSEHWLIILFFFYDFGFLGYILFPVYVNQIYSGFSNETHIDPGLSHGTHIL